MARMSETQTAAELLQRWRQGDQEAAQALFDLYSRRLTALAAQNLSQRVARRVDGEDVVQSVFRTFFRRTAGGEFQIDGSSDLWKLLVRITISKARSQGRRHTAGTRDVNLEAPPGSDGEASDPLAREPDPQEAAMLVDQIETIIAGLPDDAAAVLFQRLENRTRSEIADNLGLSRQTVYRLLELLQKRLSRELGSLD